MKSRVMAVKGPVDPEQLGLTLPHEHVLVTLFEVLARWDLKASSKTWT